MVSRYEKTKKIEEAIERVKQRKITLWEQIVTFVNSKKIGETIKRKDIIFHIYGGPMPARYRGSYGSTIDNYRRMLTRLGILEHTGRGEYELKHHLKKDLTSVQVRMLVENGISI